MAEQYQEPPDIGEFQAQPEGDLQVGGNVQPHTEGPPPVEQLQQLPRQKKERQPRKPRAPRQKKFKSRLDWLNSVHRKIKRENRGFSMQSMQVSITGPPGHAHNPFGYNGSENRPKIVRG